MRLTREEVRHIARLARLKLSADEENLYAGQLSAILEYAQRLAEVDTSGIAPTASVLPLTAPLRKDEAHQPLKTQELLSNAAQTEADQFRVPPVLNNLTGEDRNGKQE